MLEKKMKKHEKIAILKEKQKDIEKRLDQLNGPYCILCHKNIVDCHGPKVCYKCKLIATGQYEEAQKYQECLDYMIQSLDDNK